jgi:hypothetical protein
MPTLHPLEMDLLSKLTNAVRKSLSVDDNSRLDHLVFQTRYSLIRRLYKSTMRNARTPLERSASKAEIRECMIRTQLPRQIFDASEEVAFQADRTSSDTEILENTLHAVENLTGLNDSKDPITIALCKTMLNLLNVRTDHMGTRLVHHVLH